MSNLYLDRKNEEDSFPPFLPTKETEIEDLNLKFSEKEGSSQVVQNIESTKSDEEEDENNRDMEEESSESIDNDEDLLLERKKTKEDDDNNEEEEYDDNDENTEAIKYGCWQIVYTLVISYAFLCGGITTSIYTPLQNQLSENVGRAVTDFGTVVSFKFLGQVLGALLSPIIFNALIFCKLFCSERRLIILFHIIHTFFLFTTPVFDSYWWLVINHFFQGFLYEVSGIGLNILVAGLWGYSVDAPLQFTHGSYAVGLALFPFITTWVVKIIDSGTGQLYTLYFSSAALLFLSAVFLIVMDIYIVSKGLHNECDLIRIKMRKIKEKNGESNSSSSRFTWQDPFKFFFSLPVVIWTLCAILKGVSCGGYNNYAAYIVPFVEAEVLADNDTISWLVFTFWLALAIGRISNTWIIMLVRKVYAVVSVEVCIIFLMFVIILIISNVVTTHHLAVLWIFSILLGLCVGPMNAYTLSLSLNFFDIPITAFSVALIYFGSNIGNLVGSLLISAFQEDETDMLFIVGLVYFTIAILVLIIMGSIKCCVLRRQKKNIWKNFC